MADTNTPHDITAADGRTVDHVARDITRALKMERDECIPWPVDDWHGAHAALAQVVADELRDLRELVSALAGELAELRREPAPAPAPAPAEGA